MSQKNGAQNKRKARVTIVTKPLPSRQNSPSDMANSNPNASNCVTPGVCSNVNNGGKPVENHSFQQLGERLKLLGPIHCPRLLTVRLLGPRTRTTMVMIPIPIGPPSKTFSSQIPGISWELISVGGFRGGHYCRPPCGDVETRCGELLAENSRTQNTLTKFLDAKAAESVFVYVTALPFQKWKTYS